MEEDGSYLTGTLILALVTGSLLVWARLAARAGSGRAPLDYESRLPVPWNGFDVIVLGVSVLMFQGLLVAAVSRAIGIEPTTRSPEVMGAIVASRTVWMLFAIGYLVMRCRCLCRRHGL